MVYYRLKNYTCLLLDTGDESVVKWLQFFHYVTF